MSDTDEPPLLESRGGFGNGLAIGSSSTGSDWPGSNIAEAMGSASSTKRRDDIILRAVELCRRFCRIERGGLCDNIAIDELLQSGSAYAFAKASDRQGARIDMMPNQLQSRDSKTCRSAGRRGERGPSPKMKPLQLQ